MGVSVVVVTRVPTSRPATSGGRRRRPRWSLSAVSPERTSTSVPRSRPRPICRISKTPFSFGKKTHQCSPTRLDGGDRHGQDGRVADADGHGCGRRHAGTKHAVGIAHGRCERRSFGTRWTLGGRRAPPARGSPALEVPRSSAAPASLSGCAVRRARTREPSARPSTGWRHETPRCRARASGLAAPAVR